jgi:hypothetical protein
MFPGGEVPQQILDNEGSFFYTHKTYTHYFAGVAQGLRSYPSNLIRIVPAEGIAESL